MIVSRHNNIDVVNARKYVQDGLLAMWDGIENVGWGVHDPNATEWKSLTGTPPLALNGSHSWFNGDCLEYDGSKEIGGSASGYSDLLDTFTYEVCLQITHDLDNPYTNDRTLIALKGSGNIKQFGTGRKDRYDICAGGKDHASIAITQGQEYNRMTLAWVGEQPFKNGVLTKASQTDYNSVGISDNLISIGMRSNQSNPYSLPMKIFSIRIYNRQLTAKEIAHNYEIDKERFGI